MSLPPRFPVTQAQIEKVVSRFYTDIRNDPQLGPIFQAHVTDWPTHESKITRFWRNAILFERCYDGNPMQVHMKVGNITTDHFDRWLKIFDVVLDAELPPDAARGWSTLAHRIGRGLRLGIPAQSSDAPPLLNFG